MLNNAVLLANDHFAAGLRSALAKVVPRFSVQQCATTACGRIGISTSGRLRTRRVIRAARHAEAWDYLAGDCRSASRKSA